MHHENRFVHCYRRIAGVGEATARSAYIIFDALHSERSAPAPIPGLAPLAKLHLSPLHREPARNQKRKPNSSR